MWSRVLGRWLGIVAGVLGLGGWVLALSVASATPPFDPRTFIFFAAMLLAVAGVAVGAYRADAFRADDRNIILWRSLLLAATLLLVLGTVLSGFTVGYLFLPAAILAVVAALVTLFGQAARVG
jgi:hypothetical protein